MFSFSANIYIYIYIFNDIINKEFVVQSMVSYCRITVPQNLLLLMLNSDQYIIQQYNRIRATLCFLQFYIIIIIIIIVVVVVVISLFGGGGAKTLLSKYIFCLH